MADYIVSARKYRPDTFETLIGQDNIARTLKNSILRGQLSHAYLFCGPRGVGKTTTARIFAKTINCMNPSSEMDPCGECESCQSFAEGRSYCIHELDAASNNGIEDMKSLIDQVRIPPQVGKYSVYIIDEVHMLSQAAFNAFLKTLEEPPAYAIFILATTEKHKILPTILSRCQTYDFNRISIEGIVRNLKDIAAKENVKVDDESLHVIATKADGAMRDALTLFDQMVAFCGQDVKYQDVLKNLNVLDYEYSFSLVEAFLRGDHQSALLTFDEILSKGFNALHFIAALSSHFRDLIVSKGGALDALLELPDSLKKKYREQSAKCPLKFLYDALSITTACESGYKLSVNPRLHIEFALMRLAALIAPLETQPAAPAPAVPKTVPAETPAAPQPVAASESSPAPAAAPEEVAPKEETDSSRRSRADRTITSAISIKTITENKSTNHTPVQAQAAPAELTEDLIKQKWQELAAVYASKPRLANAISSAIVEFQDSEAGKIVVFQVQNEAQKTWIEGKCLFEMEGHFQRLVAAPVKLKVDVTPEEEREAKPYLPTEQAADLMSKNEEVKNLVKDFGLDLK